MKVNRTSRFFPFFVFLSLSIGVLLGVVVSKWFDGYGLNVFNESSGKMMEVLRNINDKYVEEVDMDELVDDIIPKVLEELDPHSSYIKAEDVAKAGEDLKGSFSGVGIQFKVNDDTVHITDVIKGGPSEKVGLLPGDRIISIDDESFVGDVVTNDEAMRRLKGEKGSVVKIGVKRHGVSEQIYYTVERGDIPVKSVDAVYMLDKNLGYLKINKVGETTYSEMLIALAKLQELKFNGLVMDLRGNGGGYLGAAINMVNEFLSEDKLITYTEGRIMGRADYMSDGRGSYQRIPLIILTDETTASAAEIISGAIQDNDRGIIIGRRTFGKGLVQQPIELQDGSLIYLTVSRYYTPSGRCIQKPYSKGDNEGYNMDIVNRFENGEFFSEDSIHLQGEKYLTSGGRTVYGGGGIMPDYFVAEDTTLITPYYTEIALSGLIPQFCYDYADKNRDKLAEYESASQIEYNLKTNNVLEQFIKFADSKGVKRRNIMIKKSQPLFEQMIYGTIIYYMLEFDEYVKYINSFDPAVQKAVELYNKGLAFPKI
jgi:carboxyl-terminal processing protease